MELTLFAAVEFTFLSLIPTILISKDADEFFGGTEYTIGLTWLGFAVGVNIYR